MGKRNRAEGLQRRKARVAVYLTPDEMAQLTATATATALPVGVLLRQLGLGHQPRSVIDHEQVREVIRTRGDLGRVGGLLKLWLTERAGEGVAVEDVRAVLNEIEVIAEEIRHKVRVL